MMFSKHISNSLIFKFVHVFCTHIMLLSSPRNTCCAFLQYWYCFFPTFFSNIHLLYFNLQYILFFPVSHYPNPMQPRGTVTFKFTLLDLTWFSLSKLRSWAEQFQSSLTSSASCSCHWRPVCIQLCAPPSPPDWFHLQQRQWLSCSIMIQTHAHRHTEFVGKNPEKKWNSPHFVVLQLI